MAKGYYNENSAKMALNLTIEKEDMKSLMKIEKHITYSKPTDQIRMAIKKHIAEHKPQLDKL